MTFRDPFGILTEQERTVVDGLLVRYKGHLSIPQLAEGIRVTLENARGLYQDAMALLACGRLARSMALLIATMEEVGKISVLASMSRIPKSNQKLWADAWESFRSHQHKSTWAFVGTYPDEGRSHPELMVTAACQQFTLADIGERCRQYTLYVDYHATEKRWLSPNEISEEDVAKWRARAEAALTRAEACAAANLFSERALELQREVYADFNRRRPRRKDTRPEDLARAVEDAPTLAVIYFRRLIREGVVSPDADLNVLGTPFIELMRQADSPKRTK
jgi:AbiV family abortive infection protein